MTVKLQRDNAKVELFKACASSNPQEAAMAREILGAFFGSLIDQVLDQVATHKIAYQAVPYDLNTHPTIPLEYFEENEEGLFDVWSHAMPGGLPTNHISEISDFRVDVFTLDTAVSMYKSHAAESRLNVVELAVNRMIAELVAKQEYHAWSVIFAALGAARTNGAPHVFDNANTGVFQIDDLNTLWTNLRRFRKSWRSGTPTSTPSKGLTDLVLSPEMMGQVRSFSYQPMNTRAVPNTDESTAMPLPDSVREEIFRNAGMPSIWGIGLVELLELGVDQAYNVVFDNFYTPGGGEPTFDSTSDELILGLDLALPAGWELQATDFDRNSTVSVEEDDQWVKRSKKMGWYAEWTGGYVWTDNKTLSGIVIQG